MNISFIMGLILILVVTIFLSFIFFGFQIIRPTERGIRERFGKYNEFLEPGLNWKIPLIDRIIVVNVTEKMVDVGSQEIITKDKLNAKVDCQIYFQINADEKSLKASQYNVYNCERQIVALARTTLRNIIGTLNLTETNSDRNKINTELMVVLEKETTKWGISIVRTELKEINPPQNVQETMNKVVIAENEKIANKDFAIAMETKADGEKKAKIKSAEGESESIKLIAQGNAESIRIVNESAQKYFVGNAVKLRQLEMTEKALKDNAKIIITKEGISPLLLLNEK